MFEKWLHLNFPRSGLGPERKKQLAVTRTPDRFPVAEVDKRRVDVCFSYPQAGPADYTISCEREIATKIRVVSHSVVTPGAPPGNRKQTLIRLGQDFEASVSWRRITCVLSSGIHSCEVFDEFGGRCLLGRRDVLRGIALGFDRNAHVVGALRAARED